MWVQLAQDLRRVETGGPVRRKPSGKGTDERQCRRRRDECARIARLETIEQRGHETRRPGADGQAHDDPGADQQRHASEHEADHRRARRAERHANADFGPPEAHRIRRHAIEADGRHQQREDAERRRQDREQPLARQRVADPVVERLECQGERRVDLADGRRDALREQAGLRPRRRGRSTSRSRAPSPAGSSTNELSTDCDNGTYAVGSVGSRTSR